VLARQSRCPPVWSALGLVAHSAFAGVCLFLRALKIVPLVKLDAVDEVMKLFKEGEQTMLQCRSG